MIDTEILQDYSSEARELLDEMDNSLMRLEKEGGTPELLNNIFRAVHCIKGSAEYIGLERSGTLTHGVENLLDRLREGILGLDARILDFLFRAKDRLLALIDEVSQEREEKSQVSDIMQELESLLETRDPESAISASSQEEASFQDGSELTETASQTLTPPTPTEELAESVPESTERAAGQEMGAVGLDSGEGPESRDFGVILPHDIPDYVEQQNVEASSPTAEGSPLLEETAVLGAQDPDEQNIFGEAATGSPVEQEPEECAATAELPDAGNTLEDTVPHLLNISLYLDDLCDGLHPAEVVSSILDTLGRLARSMRLIGVPEAVRILEMMEKRLACIATGDKRLPEDEIADLRALIYSLRPIYPEGLFPWEEAAAVEGEAAPILDGEPAIPLQPSSFSLKLQKIPELDHSAIAAIEAAGFSSIDQLAKAGVAALERLPELTSSMVEAILKFSGAARTASKSKPRSPKPGERSLLADIDDELLREFEGIFGEGSAQEELYPVGSYASHGGRAADLLEELYDVGEDADREIIEIFLSYGWEIMDKLSHVIEKIKQGPSDHSDLDKCVELIKSIRSSSTYMDYQSLAAFLDEWYEKTLWCAEKLETLSPRDLNFMENSLLKFRDFLQGLEVVLNPQAFEAARPTIGSEAREDEHSSAYSDSGTEPFPTKAAEAPAPPTGPVADERQQFREAPTQELEGPAPLSQPIQGAEAAGARSVGSQVEEREPTEGQERRITQDLSMARDPRESAVVKTMRVDSAKVDVLLNQVGELVVNRSYVEQLGLELKNFQRGLTAGLEVGKKEIQSIKDLSLKVAEASLSLGRVANDIQEGVMKLRMLPVGQLFNRMPRLIRDLSRRVDKVISLEVHGGDTEVDKRVIEQVYNPLVHLIRNAVDHGIEDREIRRNLGKNEEGLITLSAYSQGNQVVIDVEDDGRGIDTAAVIEKALENQLVDSQEAKNISAQELHNLLFLPGFSTSKRVTRTSGRGVGMDVVKKDVEKINGHVEIDSWENRGTRISIKIPLTLAIIQTLLIRTGKQFFAIPLTSVREIIQVTPDEITTIEGFEVIKFRDETIPVLRISEVFNLKDYDKSKHPRFLVLATAGLKTIGFLVEELIGEQDVVIKPLAEHVCEIRGLAGSTILGDGTIALVLDVMEVIEDIIAQQRQLSQMGAGYIRANSQNGLQDALDA